MSLVRTAALALAALVGLAASAPALADDAAATERQYMNRRNLGIAGMTMGYAGPVMGLGGAALTLGGLTGVATNGLNGNDTTGSANSAFGGMALLVVGGSAMYIGPPLLTAGSLSGAKTIRKNGGDVGRLAGWISLGGVTLQYGGIASGSIGTSLFGWATAMVSGTIQHAKNSTEYARIAHAPEAPKRFRVALVPTSNGAMLAGTF